MLLAYSASYAQSNLNFSIETENEDSYAVLSGYTPETETELTIPNKVTIEDKEYEVKKIAASCFSQAKNLTKVTIPNTIVSIESNAFEDCSNIKEFIFEDESNLDFIGNNAFKNCSKIESFTIPAKVTKLGRVFNGCDNLSEVTCLAETPPNLDIYFCVTDHNNSVKEILIYVPKNSIKNYDEQWNRLTLDRYYYFIPIGNKAKFVSMANGDKYIVNETTEKATLRYPAFSETKQISIPASIYFGGKTYPVTEIASCSFENAFVETIELPSTIETISSKAFWCKNLTLLICHAIIPPTTSNAVRNTVWFYPEEGKGGRGLPSHFIVQVPQEALQAYKADCHWDYQFVNYIYPIGSNATIQKINGCRFLIDPDKDYTTLLRTYKDVDFRFPTSVIYGGKLYPVTHLGPLCSPYITHKSPKIPNTIQVLETDCFWNTDGASDSIVSIKLPKSVTYIGTSAFTGCKNLTSVDLPESVTTIEGEFLNACAKLESVVCRAKIPPTFISQTIYGSHSHTTLYVPEESIPLYKKNSYWQSFKDIVSLDNYTGGDGKDTEEPMPTYSDATIGDFTYDLYHIDGVNTASLKKSNTMLPVSFTVPESVNYEGNTYQITELKDYCFNDQSKVQSIDIPEGVTTVGACFQNCTSLRELRFPSTIKKTTLDNFGLDNCPSLFSITCLALTPPETSGMKIGRTSKTTDGSIVYYPVIICVQPEAKENYEENTYWVGEIEDAHNPLCTINNPVYLIGSGTDDYNRNWFIINEKDEACLWKAANNDRYYQVPSKVTGEWSTQFTVTALSSYCFRGTGIKSITLPNTITKIQDFPWKNCTDLNEVYFRSVTPPSGNFNRILYKEEGNRVPSHLLIRVPQDALSAYNYWNNAEGCYVEASNTPWQIINQDGYKFMINRMEHIATLLRSYKEAGNIIPTSVMIDGEAYTITSIGYEAIINGEYNAESIDIPNSVRKLEGNAIYGNNAIQTIVLPNSITSIGKYAISNCNSLQTIDLPETLKEVGDLAFCENRNLQEIICRATTPPTVMNIDEYTGEYKPQPDYRLDAYPLYVPDNTVEAYKADAYWGKYATILPISSIGTGIEEVTSTKRVSITTNQGKITIVGLSEDESVALYNAEGCLLGQTTVVNGAALFHLPLQKGLIIIKTKNAHIKCLLK